MPESLRALYGGNASLTTFSGFLQAYGFGSWVWIPLLIYTALFAVSITTREVDRRTMEFLLALPVSRRQVVASRWGGMALALLVLHAAHFLAIWLGVLAIGEEPEVGRYLLADLNSWLLFLALGSVLMAIDMGIDDYGRGVGVNLGIGLALFAFHLGTETAQGALKTVRNLLPLAYYDPAAIIGRGDVPWGNLAILAGLALAGLGLGVSLFERKQIAA
jgi:ABC-2 type transport system permease protein